MKRSSVILGCVVVVAMLSMFSCESDGPAMEGSGLSDLTWERPSPQEGWTGGSRVQLLDSNTRTGAGQGEGAGAAFSASPLEALWAKGVRKGDKASTEIRSVAVDASGNIYAAGHIFTRGSSSLGDGVTVKGPSDRFNALIVKYDASGRTLWARSATDGSATTQFYSVAVDGSGNAYAVGAMNGGKIGFGGNVRLEGKYSGMNMLLVKYDAQGQVQWARTLVNADGTSEFKGVAVDKKGNVLAVGTYGAEHQEPIDFTHPGPGYTAPNKIEGSHAILVQFDPSGRVLRVSQSVAGNWGATFNSVAVDASGNAIVAGYIGGYITYSFGSGVIVKGPPPGDQRGCGKIRHIGQSPVGANPRARLSLQRVLVRGRG